MGLLDLDKALQNATKCGTWHDIKDSHGSDEIAPLVVGDIAQIMILGVTLIAASSAVFVLENALSHITRSARRLLSVEPCCKQCENADPAKQDGNDHAFVLFSHKY